MFWVSHRDNFLERRNPRSIGRPRAVVSQKPDCMVDNPEALVLRGLFCPARGAGRQGTQASQAAQVARKNQEIAAFIPILGFQASLLKKYPSSPI